MTQSNLRYWVVAGSALLAVSSLEAGRPYYSSYYRCPPATGWTPVAPARAYYYSPTQQGTPQAAQDTYRRYSVEPDDGAAPIAEPAPAPVVTPAPAAPRYVAPAPGYYQQPVDRHRDIEMRRLRPGYRF